MTSPISPALKNSARSAYRALFRASGATFAGDDRVLHAFRDKVRTETIAGRQELDPVEYEARVQHAFEVANVLRKNFVQGTKEGDTYRLRITPDTELGSNDAVKAPYSRPAKGTPRPKCGEDPNAVAPLPPKSLRGSLGVGSARSYSTQAPTVDLEPEIEVEHNKARVQSLVDKLSQVNRRVSASMTGKGKDVVVERVLLEDKLGALAARIDYLAQTHTPAEGLQPAIDALLDVVWLNQDDVAKIGKRSDPPVQMRQFVRYLQKAGKEATNARNAAVNLSPEIRLAIGEEMETPAPGTKIPGPHTPADELRFLTWRMLMVKRGMQRVAAGNGDNVNGLGGMVGAVRRTLTRLAYAQDCLQDLEENGPRNEDAKAVMDEMERAVDHSMGSPMFEMMRAVQERLEQETVWKLVDNERERCRTVRVMDDGVERNSRPRLRQPYHYLRFLEEEQATPPPAGTPEHTAWRLGQLDRTHGIVARVGQKINLITTILDELIVLFSETSKDPEKIAPLQTAKSTFQPEIFLQLKEVELPQRDVARQGTVVDWARVLGSIRMQTRVIETQLRTVDPIIRHFFRNQPVEELLANKAAQRLFVDLCSEMTIVFDCVWRVNRRLKQDKLVVLSTARGLERRTPKPGPVKGAESETGSSSGGPMAVSEVKGRYKYKPLNKSASPVPPTPRFASKNGVLGSEGATPLLHIIQGLIVDEKGSRGQLKESAE